VAVKGCVAPARRLAAVGVTLTVISGGGGCEFLFDALPQPAWTSNSARTTSRGVRRKMRSICSYSLGTEAFGDHAPKPAGKQLDESTT
jgi:hypothetical protein